MVSTPPILTSKPPQNENRGYGPGQQNTSFLSPLDIFAIVYCCFIFVAKEKSPDILAGLNLGWDHFFL